MGAGPVLHSSLIPLSAGCLLVFAVTGIGRLVLRLFRIRPLDWYWCLAFAALLGQATVSLTVQSLLLSGLSSAHRLAMLGLLLAAVGALGHFLGARPAPVGNASISVSANKFLVALLAAIWLANLAVALAPSTKIDELFYHMLVPKRIVEDGSLNYYRLPLEAAITPQMQFQISLAPAYALGFPEAGNVLSLGFSIVLALFIAGFVRRSTGSGSLALIVALACSVGIYQTVWHTTEGAHALGELAAVVALCGALWPKTLSSAVGPLPYGILINAAAALAASTKISLLPLCATVGLIALLQTYRLASNAPHRFAASTLALLPWIPIHFPLMIWTYRQSGSFWGPVMANTLGRSIFPVSILHLLTQYRINNQISLAANIRLAVIELSPLLLVGIALCAWLAWRRNRPALTVAALFLMQGILILWLLPYDFRFFGGLLYIPLIAAALAFASSPPLSDGVAVLTPFGHHVVRARNWLALAMILPWLALQIYFAVPFAEVSAGVLPRSAFLERYVALTRDFVALDRILPSNAVLYIPEGRHPLYRSPRPVVLTPLDLRQRTTVFMLDTSKSGEFAPDPAMVGMTCGQIVYSDQDAVVATFRTPGRPAIIGNVTVRKCQLPSLFAADSSASASARSASSSSSSSVAAR